MLPEINDLLTTLSRSKALFYRDALERLGQAALDQAQENGYVAIINDDDEDVVYLTRKGRLEMGMKSQYHPTPQAAFNSAFIASLAHRFQIALGSSVDTPRKYAMSYRLNNRHVIGLARKDGFNRTTLRRLYEQNVTSGDYDEMHIFFYHANEEELCHLSDLLFTPEEMKTPVSREAVRLYSVQSLAG